jgi:hypothetical protein
LIKAFFLTKKKKKGKKRREATIKVAESSGNKAHELFSKLLDLGIKT